MKNQKNEIALSEQYKEKLNAFFDQLSFKCVPACNVHNEISRWQRASGFHAEIFEFVSLRLMSPRMVDAMFIITVGMSSPLAGSMERLAGTSECSDLLMTLDDGTTPYQDDMLSIPVNWLVVNEGGDASVLWKFFHPDLDKEMRCFENTFNEYVIPLFAGLRTADALTSYMWSLYEINNVKHSVGAHSPDEIAYIALIRFHSGKKQDAIDFLEFAARGRYPQRIQKMIDKGSANEKIIQCRIGKVKHYLEKTA